MSIDIVVLGSLNMDLVIKAERVPEVGETLPGQEFKTIPGGKGANQSVAIAKIGGKVAMVGRVGADDFGKQLIKDLTEFGVDASHVLVDPDSPTGIALIVVDKNGGNRILVVARANGKETKEDVDAVEPLIRQAKMLVMQMEIPIETVKYALDIASGLGVPVVLNLAPAYPVPDEVLRKVNYLVINEIEAYVLSGIRVEDLLSAQQAASILLGRGANVVILTLGGQGALLATQSSMEFFPAFKVDVVDTTAAGDAFIGGFVVSLLETGNLSESMCFASALGALTTTNFGAQSSLPTRREVNDFLSQAHLKPTFLNGEVLRSGYPKILGNPNDSPVHGKEVVDI